MALKNVYVDISSHNGTPDLQAYWNDGHRTLCLKATEGTGYAWQQMPALAQQWHSLGPDAQCIFYHWLYGTFSGALQFSWFWAHVSPVFRTGDRLMTDFEDVDPSRWTSDATHAKVVQEFNALCDQRAPTMDYAPSWYLNNMPLCVAYFATRKMWVPSDYSHDPPLNPYGFNPVAHQFTDRATVAGFSGPVDYNRWITPPVTAGDVVTPADIAAIADAVYTKLLKTDGVLNSPADAGDHATNPYWGWQTHIEATTTAARAGRTDIAAVKSAVAVLSAQLPALKAQVDAVAKTVNAGSPAVIADIGTRVAELQAAVAQLTATPPGAVDATAVVNELATRLNA